jgi:hypothetical protein
MRYKATYTPHERLLAGNWVTVGDASAGDP